MGLFVSLQNTQTRLTCKMARIVASVALLACSTLSAPQFQGDSSNARILQEQRFNAGAGKFGSALCSSVPRRFQQCQDPAGAEIQCWSWKVWICFRPGGRGGVQGGERGEQREDRTVQLHWG